MQRPAREVEGTMTRINCPHCEYYTYLHLMGDGNAMLQRHIAKTHFGVCEPVPQDYSIDPPASAA